MSCRVSLRQSERIEADRRVLSVHVEAAVWPGAPVRIEPRPSVAIQVRPVDGGVTIEVDLDPSLDPFAAWDAAIRHAPARADVPWWGEVLRVDWRDVLL